jgi:hypothetical protein
MGLTLREIRDEDLPLLFEQWADPVAVHMAAFTAPDHMDRDAFERRWSRLRADETVLARSGTNPLFARQHKTVGCGAELSRSFLIGVAVGCRWLRRSAPSLHPVLSAVATGL